MSEGFHIVVCGSLVPDPLQMLEPIEPRRLHLGEDYPITWGESCFDMVFHVCGDPNLYSNLPP